MVGKLCFIITASRTAEASALRLHILNIEDPPILLVPFLLMIAMESQLTEVIKIQES